MKALIVLGLILILCVILMVVFWKKSRKGKKTSKKAKCDDDQISSLTEQEKEIDMLIDELNNL
jgi:FtsZ-interacting cell division protein ZipA